MLPAEAVRAAVKRLGTPRDKDPQKTVEMLQGLAEPPVEALIAELHPIADEWPPAAAHASEWWHVLWCERALRSITGQCAPAGGSSFWGETNGRPHLFVESQEVQKEVIQAWKAWWISHRRGFHAAPFVPADDSWGFLYAAAICSP
jgi:hypothetical protein